MIDGMDAIDACYHFAGVLGQRPRGLTLRQLWRLASGRIKQRRREMVEQSQLVWGLADIDAERYLQHGIMTDKKPFRLSQEMEEQIAAEMERLRKEEAQREK